MTTGRINQVTTVRRDNTRPQQTLAYNEWRRFKGTITPKWLGISILAPVGPRVFTTTAQQASRALFSIAQATEKTDSLLRVAPLSLS